YGVLVKNWRRTRFGSRFGEGGRVATRDSLAYPGAIEPRRIPRVGPEDRGAADMETRRLGTTGLEVAPLALGGNVFGWTADEPTSFRILAAFVAAGFNLVDTADVYSRWVPGNQGGESETILGKWLKQGGKRDKIVLATKVGLEMGPGQKGLARPYILQAVE